MRIILENIGDNQSKKISQARLSEIYRKLFNASAEGQYILDDLANKAGMFNVTKDKDNLQYREGMRSLYLYIISQITNSKNIQENDNISKDDYKAII